MNLQKGQKIKLSDLTASSQIELKTTVSMRAGEADVTCFGVDSNSMLSDDRYFIFYNQTSSPEAAISMKNDSSGAIFSIDLKKLPPFIKKLVLTAAVDGDGDMKDVENGRLALCSGGQELAEFTFQGSQFQQEKAVILCEIYEKDGIWRMSVVSSGFNGGLGALLEHFGGKEAAPGPTPAPASPAEKAPAPSPVPVPITAEKPTISMNTNTAPEPPKKVSLKKSGDSHKISLKKNNGEIHVNLNWNKGKTSKGLFSLGTKSGGIDLDLACMFKLKTGEMGVIQALGNSFGSAVRPPYIFLDQDDRSGNSQNGENMWFKKPELIEFAIVFAYIYEGVANWKQTDATVVLKQPGSPDIEIHMDDCRSQDRFCVIASLAARGDELEVRREERFFKSHREVDKGYGFGFRWVAGKK